MVREVTFIHAADLHLDSPFKGLIDLPSNLFADVKNSTFDALTNLVDVAIEQKVDFVLITGDLFDNEKQSLKAQIRLKRAFERLQEYEIQVFLSYGNHDYMKGNVHQVTYPENVHIFPDEQVRSFNYERNNEILAKIYGFSYVNRAVSKNKAKDFIIENPDVPFHIAMLHGSIQGNDEHDPYAPFQLSDLVAKDFQYWALGHIHKRTVLKEDPYIVYPGNTQGRHRKETGEKGCYVVRITADSTDIRFIPLHVIEFTSLSINVSDTEEIFELEQEIRNTVKKRTMESPQLIDLTLTSNHSKLRQWQTEGRVEDIIEIINESLSTEKNWQYIFKTTIEVIEQLEPHETSYGEHFLGELQQRFNESTGLEYLSELYQHRQARKHLDLPDAMEAKEWKAEARDRLLGQLLRGGGQ